MVKKQSVFDEELWCEDCGVGYTSSCVKHGGYSRIKDKAIPSRARLTTPHQLVVKMLEMTADHSHVYGVFAKKVIQKRTQLGPYEGQITETWDHGRGDRIKLQLCNINGRSSFFDCKNEAECNWMMFVRPAKTPKEQNLVAFQHKGGIYFVTTKAIRINEELKVWYAKSYERLIRMCNGCTTVRSDSVTQDEIPSQKEPSPQEQSSSSDVLTPQRRSSRRKIKASANKKSPGEDVSEQVLSDVVKTTEDAIRTVAETAATTALDDCTVQPPYSDSSPNAKEDKKSPSLRRGNRKRKIHPEAVVSQQAAQGLETDIMPAMVQVTVGGTEIELNPIIPEPVHNPELLQDDNDDYIELHGFEPVDSPEMDNMSNEMNTQHGPTDQNATIATPVENTITSQEGEKEAVIGDDRSNVIIHSVQQVVVSDQEINSTVPVNQPFNALRFVENAEPQNQETSTDETNTPSVVTPTKSPTKPNEKRPVIKKEKNKRSSPRRKEKKANIDEEEDEFTPKKAFHCTSCEQIFPSELKLDTHMRLVHSGEKPFLCIVCKKRFQTAFKLKRHMTTHGEGAMFSCPYCDKSFGRKDHLKSHLRVHNPEKEVFDCTFCDKKYYSTYAFKCHIAQHNADRGELTCTVCDKEFKTSEEIQYHLKVHAGSRTVKDESQKKHQCPKCNMKFFTKKDIERHIVTHTKQRAFMCHLCPQRFGRQDHLTRHIRTAHSGNAKKKRKAEPPTEDLLSQVDALKPPPMKEKKSPMKTRQRKDIPVGESKQDKSNEQSTVLGTAVSAENNTDTKGDELVLVFDGTNLIWRKQSSVITQPMTSSDQIQAPSQNLTILQPAAITQPITQNSPSLASQKTIQIPSSLLATNSDLHVSALQSNISDIDIVLKNLENEAELIKATENKAQKGSGKSLKRKGSGSSKKSGGKRSSKGRRSSSRSSLSSQPTLPVDTLPGTSHLASPPPVPKSSATQQPSTVAGASNVNISFIDKLNLTELFGEKAKSIQKNVQLQLLKELQSVQQKVAPPSSANQQAPASQQQVLQQVPLQVPSSSIFTLNLPQNVHSGGNLAATAAGQVIQIGNRQGSTQTPTLSTIDTQTIVQQIQQMLNTNVNNEPIVLEAASNQVPIPQNVQLLQVYDTNGTPIQQPGQVITPVTGQTQVGNPQVPVQVTSHVIPGNYPPAQNQVIMIPENWKMVYPNESEKSGV